MKTWFITGTSRGFGREWAIAALERGDKVAATARDIAALDDLVAKARAERFPAQGEPIATREAILTLVDSENPPLRMFLGESPLRIATADYESRLATWREWQPVAAAAQGS